MPGLRVVQLRCEYLEDPLGIDVRIPRLGWKLEAVHKGSRGITQASYRILVASDPGKLAMDQGDLWDSGKVASGETTQIAYSGKPLGSRQRCYWKVRVWDQRGHAAHWSPTACWSMGLLEPGDWGARWISDGVAPSEPARGAHNGYHSQFATSADTAKWVSVDLGESRKVDSVRLFPARPYDWSPDTPGFLFPLRFRVEVSDSPDFASAQTVVDRTAQDVPSPGTEPLSLSFDRVAARYVRLTATRLRERDGGQFGLALAEMQVLGGGKVVSQGAKVAALDSIESGAWSAANLTNGDTTSHPAGASKALPAPLLRRSLRLDGPIRRATVYVTALGLYELHINGARVGDHVLAPEWTDYHRRVQYQTYDVTPLLRPGDNALAALLGDGWYAGRIGLSNIVPGGPDRGIYGPRPALMLRLEVERADGSVETVVSDGAWRRAPESFVRSSDILDGETVDARLESDGWDRPGFDDSGWAAAKVLSLKSPALVAQPNEPIRVTREVKPVSLKQVEAGVFIYDLGQNLVGWCRLKLKAPAGTEVTLRHAEVLEPDGSLYTANLRGAPQIDRYTCRGGDEEAFEPRFTYHGFRYVEVSGLPKKPALRDLVARVFHSSSPEVGSFECSDPELNRLWQNVLWTQRANLMSSPTDCPQRDERLGWMGDIQSFCQTGLFNMDLAAFLTKWLRDVRDAQTKDGRFPDFAPHPFGPEERFSGAPAWSDAGVFVPWTLYLNTGDHRILEEQFEAARRWVEFVRGKNPDLLWRNARGNDYNDWLNADTQVLEDWPKQGGAVPPEVLATAFFARSTELVSRMADVLGRSKEAKQYGELARGIREAFNRAYVSPEGRVQGDTQAGYALALSFDLLPEALRPAALGFMVEGLKPYRGHLSTGIQTTHRLMQELTRGGRTDVAYELLNQRTIPSWRYTVEHGATTIWERWDGWVEGRGYQDPGMNSFNHWALGAVGEWMMRVIGGLNSDESHPGWRRFLLKPQPGGGLTWARVAYDSPRGRIGLNWKQEGATLHLEVSVPPSTTAEVHVPASEGSQVKESGQPAGASPWLRHLRRQDGCEVYEVSSGDYRFEVGG
jgi:alpha-L-rhamnosidase